MNKPSPITSILLFAGAAMLLFACFSASWFSYSSGEFSSSMGLIRGEFCEDGSCKSFTIFEGGGKIGGIGAFVILTFLISLAAAVMSGVAGLLLLRPGRTVMSVLAMSFAAAAGLFGLIVIVRFGTKGPGISYGTIVFLLGFGLALTGSIMGMARKRAMPAMGARPPYGHPGMPHGAPYPQHAAQMPYGQPSPQAPNPYAPPPQHVAGAPCATCATPTTWVAQYNRWFCGRCQTYV